MTQNNVIFCGPDYLRGYKYNWSLNKCMEHGHSLNQVRITFYQNKLMA